MPRPIKSFASAGFAKQIMQGIAKAGYEKPTPIQSQAWPVLMSGRDVIGIAKTGSGKTAAFVLPGLTHLMDQPELEKNDGPIMVVLAPTRELAAQIHTETKKFAKSFGLKVGAIYGGMSKFEQFTKQFRIFDLPFMFKDINAVDEFQNSETGVAMKESMTRRGLLGLAFWHNGMKQMSANKPLNVPSD